LKQNEIHINIKDIKAEPIIANNPEAKFRINARGCFYRNFNEDIIESSNYNNNTIEVNLSRDGIFHLLPESLFFSENRLLIKKRKRNKNSDIIQEDAIKEEIKKQNIDRKQLLVFFKYFDNKYFNSNILLEKCIYEIENNSFNILLNNFFDFDLTNEENQYIKKMAPLLIHADKIRGELFLLQKILSNVLNCKVEISRKNLLNIELSEVITSLEFIIHKKDLTLSEYQTLNRDYKSFFEFIYEWFLPFEIDYVYKIKDITHRLVLKQTLILDYNTQLLLNES